MVQSFLVMVVTLLLGFQGIPGDAYNNNGQQSYLMDLMYPNSIMEIADNEVPLAGPQQNANSAKGGNQTQRPDAGNDSPATPQTTQTATAKPTAKPTHPPKPTATIEPTVTIEPTQTTKPTATIEPTQTTKPTATIEPTQTAKPTATIEPTQTAKPTPVPTQTEPQSTETNPTPTVTPVRQSVAQRLLAQANALLTQYNACTTADQKKELLGASNYALGNDAFRKKLVNDLGGAWETVETEVVSATQYQQGKTLYAQVYMSGLASDFQPVVYATQNANLSGNQWATNLVYDEITDSWMEYTKKHPYNNSRVSYGMTALAKEGSLEALQDDMQTSEYWDEVQPMETDATAGGALPGDTADKAEILPLTAAEPIAEATALPKDSTGDAAGQPTVSDEAAKESKAPEPPKEQPPATEPSVQTTPEQPDQAEEKETPSVDATQAATEGAPSEASTEPVDAR